MKYTGRDISVGIGKETSRGTPVSATFWIPRSSLDFEEQVTTITDDQVYGVIEDSVDVKKVSGWAEGSLSGMVRDKAIGLFLYNAFGAVSSTPEGEYYKHTFTIDQDHQHQSFTIATDGGVEDTAYPLGMIKSLEINATINEAVLFTADLISKAGTGTPATAAYVAENSFTCEDAKVYFADTQADLDAADETKIKSTKITIEKEVEKDDVLGATTPDDLLNKTVRVSVEIEKNYENDTYRDMFKDATGKAMRLAISSGTPASLAIDLNQIKITEWSRDRSSDEITKETFTAKANFKIADSKMIGAELINNQEDY
jgi:hypothetical protein